MADLQDPVDLVHAILTNLGYDANKERTESRALSAPGYVFIEEVTGSIPHLQYSDRPGVQIVVYSVNGFSASRRLAYDILRDLQSQQGVKYVIGGLNSGIHRVITTLRPARQDINGLPSGTGRTVCQIDLILSTQDHWS